VSWSDADPDLEVNMPALLTTDGTPVPRPITDDSIPRWNAPAFVVRLREVHKVDFCGCGDEVEVPGTWLAYDPPDRWRPNGYWHTRDKIEGAARFATYAEALDAIGCDLLVDPEQRHEAYVEEYEPRHRAPDGRPIIFVNVYRTGQAYGGPEEGGWWFTVSEVVTSVPCHNLVQAEEVQEKLVERFSTRDGYYGDERYVVVLETHEGEAEPRTRPHYC
jgi:hypothetical protein